MARSPLPASFFGVVLGLSGLGQAWRVAVQLWGVPAAIGEGLLLLATLVWTWLLVAQVVTGLETVLTTNQSSLASRPGNNTEV